MDTLDDGYTPADLRAVIAGEKAHTPRKNATAPVKPEKRSGNLLVDIQAKLRAGKGTGYALSLIHISLPIRSHRRTLTTRVWIGTTT